jgi:hypothetical protein
LDAGCAQAAPEETPMTPDRYAALQRQGQQLAAELAALQQRLATYLQAVDEELWLELIRPEPDQSAHIPAASDCAQVVENEHIPSDYRRHLDIILF